MNLDASCASCVYSKNISRGYLCCRFPPVLVKQNKTAEETYTEQFNWEFPLVSEMDRCGEWAKS